MKGFIGSGSIDTNSRLCMASVVAGYRRAFGADAVPSAYEDIEQAELVVIVGSNTAWCHPVRYQRLAAAKAAHPALRLVVIDPRRTATCEIADLFLPLAPGTDVMLFNGLLSHLCREDAPASPWAARRCSTPSARKRSSPPSRSAARSRPAPTAAPASPSSKRCSPKPSLPDAQHPGDRGARRLAPSAAASALICEQPGERARARVTIMRVTP